MKTRGVKMLDPVLQTAQIDWLIVPVRECRSASDERQLVCTYFRQPHEPWGAEKAFVLPVKVRRGRGHVLFCQESGVMDYAGARSTTTLDVQPV
jgi:hypothetical protein